MKLAESVTFGGAGLDRAAHLRSQPEALAALLAGTEARVLPIWRGKPLLAPDAAGLEWLTAGHPFLSTTTAAPIFLGLSEEGARFAADVSAWQPDHVDESVGAFSDPSLQEPPGMRAGAAFGELRANMTRLTPEEAELAATGKAILGWHETHGFCARCGSASEISQGGWQRTCPSCGGHHFPRTDPVVIMLVLHGNDVLIGRSPGWPDGMYSLLAGFVEPGETIEAAVRREVAEETRVPIGEVSYLASQPWPFPSSLMVGCLGRALGREIELDPVELDDAIWVSREDMAEIYAGARDDIRPARRGSIAHFLIGRWLADTLD